MSSAFDQSIDLVGYLRLFWRQRGIIVLSAVSVVCGTLVMLSRMPPIYESQVTLTIQESRVLTKELQQFVGGERNEPDWRIHEQRLAVLTEQVKGRAFLERLVRDLGLTEDPNLRERAAAQAERRPDIGADEFAVRMLVGQLKSNIEIELLGDGLYAIRVTELDASKSRLLAQSIAELLIDVDQAAAYEQMQRSMQFGMGQLQRYEDRLRESEQALERFQKIIIETDQKSLMVKAENLPLAEILNREIQRSAGRAADRLVPLGAEVRSLLSNDAEVLWTETRVAELQSRITATLEDAIATRLSKNEEGASPWPPKGNYEVLRRDLLRHIEHRAAGLYPALGPDPVRRIARYAFARVDAGGHLQVAKFLQQEIATFKARAQSQPMREMEIRRLQSEVNVNREFLESFRAQLVAGEISEVVKTMNLGQRKEILNAAELPLTPSRPDKMKILLGAILIGPFLGAAIAFGVDALDPTLRTLADFRGVVPEPILGTLPLLTRLEPRHRGIRRILVPAAVLAIVIITATYFVMRSTEPLKVAETDTPDALVQPKDAGQ